MVFLPTVTTDWINDWISFWIFSFYEHRIQQKTFEPIQISSRALRTTAPRTRIPLTRTFKVKDRLNSYRRGTVLQKFSQTISLISEILNRMINVTSKWCEDEWHEFMCIYYLHWWSVYGSVNSPWITFSFEHIYDYHIKIHQSNRELPRKAIFICNFYKILDSLLLQVKSVERRYRHD